MVSLRCRSELISSQRMEGIIQSFRSRTSESFEKRILRDFRGWLLAGPTTPKRTNSWMKKSEYTRSVSLLLLHLLYHSNFTLEQTRRFEAHRTRSQELEMICTSSLTSYLYTKVGLDLLNSNSSCPRARGQK